MRPNFGPIAPETWTLESAQAYLREAQEFDQDVAATAKGVDATSRKNYLMACAVLADFTLEDLHPVSGDGSPQEAETVLKEDLVDLITLKGSPKVWTLDPLSRQEGLSMLRTTDEMWRVRQLNLAQGKSHVQEVFDAFLQGRFGSAESDSPQELESARQVAIWLGPWISNLPAPETIERRMALRRLMAPMDRLTAGFLGRTSELAQLRTFVGILDPTTNLETLVRFFKNLGSPRKAPLLVHGAGGVGKSTLIAEFLREHVGSAVPFPWIYLDFDNPRLNVARIGTLVHEAANQLDGQYGFPEVWRKLREQTTHSAREIDAARYSSGDGARSASAADSDDALETQIRAERAMAESLAAAIKECLDTSFLGRTAQMSEMMPFLLVLDTFEEVQKRGVVRAAPMWRFLDALQNSFPKLRLLVSGRALVKELALNGKAYEPLPLKEFDQPSALTMLKSRGVTDDATARALYAQVGGNPLSLKLASKVAMTEGTGKSGIEGLKTKILWLFDADETVVQGRLYDRILNRIRDEDVQKLAHPGLVVRRITPEVIRQVLAGPCELVQPGFEMDEARAVSLFNALELQVDLVFREPDGALRHQQDVRRVMLKMLQQERPKQVRQIHENAFRYYGEQSPANSISRIEALYHFLQLSPTENDVAGLWSRTPEASESLLSSIEELPTSSQLIVYLLAGREPSPELKKLADSDQWERATERSAREALQYGDYKTVRALLSERADRMPGSALYAIEVTLEMASRSLDKALKLVEAGIESAQSVNNVERLLELFRLRGEIRQRQSRPDEAEKDFAYAQSLAGRIGQAVLQLQIFADRVQVTGLNAPLPVAELDDILARITDADFAAVRGQIRGLFERCGPLSDALLVKGLRVFSLDDIPQWEIQDNFGHYAPEIIEAQRQRRSNEYLDGLLKADKNDRALRVGLATILEQALNPNVAARMA